MAAQQWQQVKEIFNTAVELETGPRRLYLAAVCASDQSLRHQVERLIDEDKLADDFLEDSPIQLNNSQQLSETDDPVIGQRVGSYRILRELGRGGMGTVYLAGRDDEQYERQVAIKIIKNGLDSKMMLRRFRNERQILAGLDHPNIARLIDSGMTPEGLPWYAMEYVAGSFVDDYCATQQLTVTERLKLFLTISSAVHYAHQHLVIHRDLKPSNILVTRDGVPKLLDFGIAKLLSDKPLTSEADTGTQTMTGALMMTPAYASPEQVRGEHLTTASDVYALGVILYELLTGQRPYMFTSQRPDEIVRVICEQEPERPSAVIARSTLGHASPIVLATREGSRDRLARRLRGELDNIVLMALRKDSARRYSSVENFSEDIRRYLSELPIQARPDTISYRARKFVQRNRITVCAGVIVLLSLCGGIVMTWQQARLAQRQRALAERRFNDVRQLANSFVFKYHDAIASLPGSTPVREMLVRDATAYLAKLSQETSQEMSDEVGLKLELAQAWLKVGDVQGKPYRGNLGDTNAALGSYNHALSLSESVAQVAPQNPAAQRLLSFAHESTGIIQTRLGQADAALTHLQQAVAIREQLAMHHPADDEYRRLLGAVYLNLGDTILRSSKTSAEMDINQQSLIWFQKSLTIREQLSAAQPDDLKHALELAVSFQRTGNALYQISRQHNDHQLLTEALDNHRKSVAVFEKIAAASPQNAQARRDLVDQYLMKAEPQAMAGDVDGALADCYRAAEVFAEMSAADPTNAELRRDLATAWYIVTVICEPIKRYDEGIASMQKAVAIYEALTISDPTNMDNYSDLANGCTRLSSMQEQRGNLTSAVSVLHKALEYRQKILTINPASPSTRIGIADQLFTLAGLNHRMAAGARSKRQKKAYIREALNHYQRCLEIRTGLDNDGAVAMSTLDDVKREIALCELAVKKQRKE